MNYKKRIEKIIKHLKKKKRILLLTTSNRWGTEIPKSNLIAKKIYNSLGKKAKIIDVSKLKIYPCEGNVSTKNGNICGLKQARLKDKRKNPSGFHRCWASINNKDDELWKITKELFASETIIFFSSVRWGQTNAIYQKLIERLNFIENIYTTLEEKNLLKNKEAGLILIGHNWNSKKALQTEKQVLSFFGFQTPRKLFLSWQYTDNPLDESKKSYKLAYDKFAKEFEL